MVRILLSGSGRRFYTRDLRARPACGRRSIGKNRGESMRLPAVVLVATALFAAVPAAAQTYPSKSVRLIAPFAPGGATDVLARLAAQKLGERWGHTVIVDNRVGAGGHIGAELASRAAPDGYTLVVAGTPHAIGMSLYQKLGYDFAKDLAPANRIPTCPRPIGVHPALPLNDVKELIAI